MQNRMTVQRTLMPLVPMPRTAPATRSLPAVAARNDEEITTIITPMRLPAGPQSKILRDIIHTTDFHGCDPKGVIAQLEKNHVIKMNGEDASLCDHDFDLRTIINLGDTFDRGPLGNAFKLWDLFAQLQEQCVPGGKTNVVRLLGNHELCYLQGKLLVQSEKSFGIRDAITRAIRYGVDGRWVQAAYAERDKLYTHAGVHIGFFSEFAGREAADVAEEINRRFNNGVSTNNYNDDIFDKHFGIFWNKNINALQNPYFRQVIGHVSNLDPMNEIFYGIQADPGARVWMLDAGRVKAELVRDDYEEGASGIHHFSKANEICHSVIRDEGRSEVFRW